MIYSNVLEAIGHTPIIQLSSRMVDEESARVLVKFEGLNVGGSIKTRTAYNMICQAEEQGLLTKDSIIVEPTSGWRCPHIPEYSRRCFRHREPELPLHRSARREDGAPG